jgi:hypothetical protein|uniref:Uncharacterized protein n=1 Tax=viral metagenome TaxID=1070528 RepID=A0A6C0BYK8_9ZZZZ
MSKEVPFERMKKSDGSANPKYVDVLEEDKAIAGQKFFAMSFISPEQILKEKNIFLFDYFLKYWDFSKSMEKFTQFLNFLSFKYKFDNESLMKDLEEFVTSEKDNLMATTVEDEYKNFLDRKGDELEKIFNEKHNFQTNTRGLKVRGSYPTQQEAELRAKLLREVDPNHDVYVGPVGMWVPFNPDAYKTGRVEYLEEELNQLMHDKMDNEKQAKQQFEKRVLEAKKKAIQDNKEKARESGNKLTQNIDENGNLVGVGTTSIEKTTGNDELSSADIRKELFEGEDIRTRATDSKNKRN